MKTLLVILLTSAFLVGAEICQPTTCDCFEDFGDLEYQCPSERSKEKLVIHKGSDEIVVSCWYTETPDYFLPNISFSAPQIRISDCSVSLRTAIVFHVDQAVYLRVENSILQPFHYLHFLSIPMRKLEKLSLRGIKLHADINFERIIAPNLISVELEDVDFEWGVKIFKNRTQLRELNLSFNNIVELDENIFENLKQLEHLHLSSNKIEFLHDIFGNLSKLQTLNLDFNYIQILNNRTFRNLEQLNSLDLSNNNISVLNRSVLNPLKYLENINLDHNANLYLDDYLLANFSKLQYVSIQFSNLRNIPENLFRNSSNINRISLGNNYLEHIPETLFQGLLKLEILNLHNNVIKKLQADTFKTLINLEILELHHNQIVSIDANIFQPLENLLELRLYNNEISYINNDSFKFNKRLETILMADNKYTYKINEGHYFAVSPFSSCSRLKELDLSNNFVEDVMEDLFVYLKDLRSLNLKNNSIENVDVVSIWKIAKRGIVLNLEYNKINNFFFDESLIQIEEYLHNDEMNGDSIVLISNNPLNCDCHAQTFLQFLQNFTERQNHGFFFKYEELSCNTPTSLNGTKFAEISPEDLICPIDVITNDTSCASTNSCECFWQPYERSVIVDCARKNLTIFPHILVSPNLEFEQIFVHLEGNYLTEIATDISGYNNVTKLYLNNNKISNLSWIPENLDVLEVRFNKLKRLDDGILNKLNSSSIKNVSLGYNPWSCGCEVDNLTKFLRKNVKMIDVANVRCRGTGAMLVNLTTEHVCKNRVLMYMVFTIVMCIILSIIFITLAIYYKYTHQIKVWLYSRNICTSRLVEEELDKNKKYDVFISFSHKDEEFVINTLLPELEKSTRPYKVCIHLRDWVAGEFIANNIVTSVIQSKRTLVVLSPNFLESVWGKMEFRTAHTEAMREKRNRVILVIKDEINVKSLDDELQNYMKTNTYIKWNDPWFWEKLKYALPRKQIERC